MCEVFQIRALVKTDTRDRSRISRSVAQVDRTLHVATSHRNIAATTHETPQLVQYVLGKQQTTADALSRAPVESPASDDELFVAEAEEFASHAVNILSATNKRLDENNHHLKVDEECCEIREYCLHGWPAYNKPHQPLLGQHWESQCHLAIVDDILQYDESIVIPRAMRM